MMRKLFACSIVCTCAYGSLAAGSPADGPAQPAYIAIGLAHLQHELALTPDQVARVKAAMEANANGTATKTVVEVLRETCPPARFAAWWQTVLVFERAEAARTASAETDRAEQTILLTVKQKANAVAALTQIELADRLYRASSHTDSELDAHLGQLAADREAALERILTPAQLAIRTELAQTNLNKPWPDLSALSFNANLSPGRYDWKSDSATP